MVWVVLMAALVASACGSEAVETGTATNDLAQSSGDAQETTVAAGARESPPEFAWWETTLEEGDGAAAIGELRIDGNCIYVDTVDGNTALLVLPFPQTTIDFQTGVVSLAGSEVGDGDRVAAGGGGGSRSEEGWPDCDPVGRFFAHSLGRSAIDGTLDCGADEQRFSAVAEIDVNAPGLPSPEALEAGLRSYITGPEDEIVVIDETTASLVVRGRERVVGVATQVGAGVFVMTSATGCAGRE